MEVILGLVSAGLLTAFLMKVWFDGSLFFNVHDKIARQIFVHDNNKLVLSEEGEPIEKPFLLKNIFTWHRPFLRGISCKLCFTTQVSLLFGLYLQWTKMNENLPLGYLASVAIIFVVAYVTLTKFLTDEG